MPGDPIAYEGALIPFAIKAANAGYSANRFARELTAAGAGIRRAVALKVFQEGRRLAAEYRQEPLRPLGQVPTFAESRQWPTRDSAGVLQTVQLIYREKVTGNVLVRYYSVKSAEGVTRGEAIAQAIAAYNSAPPAVAGGSRPEQADLIDAVHVGTALLVPEVAA